MPGAAPGGLLAPPVCPVCGGRAADPSFEKAGFSHFHCRDCHALYLHPPPSERELSDYYLVHEEETRSSQCWARDEPHYRHYEPIWDKALRQIERVAGRGPLLDVGCGGGQFLAFARSRGWKELEGIEPVAGAAERARERTGARVRAVDFLAAGLAGGRFAGITMWNVIEHAREPRAFAAEVRRLLRPSGVFVADCPNRYGLTLRLIGASAWVVMPPEHLVYFSHRALRRLLEGAGLKVDELGSNTIYVNDWVRFLGRPAGEAEARERHLSWYARLTGPAPARGLIRFANALLNRLHLGDQMLVAASRPRSSRAAKVA